MDYREIRAIVGHAKRTIMFLAVAHRHVPRKWTRFRSGRLDVYATECTRCGAKGRLAIGDNVRFYGVIFAVRCTNPKPKRR